MCCLAMSGDNYKYIVDYTLDTNVTLNSLNLTFY